MLTRELGAPVPEIEFRAAEGGAGATLVGYAARFNSPSSPIGGRYVEYIAPGAFDDVLNTDVVALFDHDSTRVLGRTSAGSLRLSVDDLGLRYEVDLDLEDPDAIAVQRKLLTRKVTGSSFAFQVAQDSETWDREGDVRTRTIQRISALYDVGPVTYPAYPASSAALRSLDACEAAAAAEAARDAEIRRAADARARRLALLNI